MAGAGVASATPINVAILSTLGNQNFETDVLSKIQPNAPFLNVEVLNVDTSTPTLATLDLYAAVMVIGNQPFADAITLGSNLKQYLDQGRGVVVAGLSNTYTNCSSASTSQLCGDFQTANYWAIQPGIHRTGASTLGTVYLPNDPLLAGVTSFDGGTTADRISGAVNPLATRVADWSDGTPLIARRTFASGGREVALNFFPVSGDAWPGFWVSSTNGAQIMANALNEAADLPEPATYLMTGTGFALMSLLLRRRRRTLQCESAPRPRHR